MGNNWGIVLAAGSSTRMGTQKLLLPYREDTIIGTVVNQVLASKVDHVMVVLGADHQEIKAALEGRSVEFCHNREHARGMLSSVMCGVRSLPEDANAALVFLGDQPEISPGVTNAVIEAYDEDIKGIVIPVHQHRRGHPLLVDLKYRKEIDRLDLEQGLRALMHLFPEDVLEVEVEEPGILVDIDTREDYSRATK
ncbi:MAG: nucleotidyltransferase family protein [Bacteroidales bacterium]